MATDFLSTAVKNNVFGKYDPQEHKEKEEIYEEKPKVTTKENAKEKNKEKKEKKKDKKKKGSAAESNVELWITN